MRGVLIAAWCALLLGAPRPLVAGEAGLAGTSFEVGPGAYCLRGAADPTRGDRPSFDRSRPAEGAVCLRWPVRRGSTSAAVEWPQRSYAVGQGLVVSVMMRAVPAGLPGRITLRAPDGAVLAQASYALSADWRRYELDWTPSAGAERAWIEIAPGPAAADSLWYVDDLRLGLADGEPADVLPELAVQRAGAALRWAGQSARFDVRLRSPRGVPDVAWNWRLESASGQVLRRAAGLLSLADGRANVPVKVGALAPGAYRLWVEALCEGHALSAADSLVVVEPQLGELPRWGGVEGVSAPDAAEDMVLLRFGRLRGAAGSEAQAEIPARQRKLLTAARHEGIDTVGYWPADERALASWSRLINWWEPPVGEFWRSVADDGDRLRERRAALKGRARFCGVRLAAVPDPLQTLGDIAEEGLLASTDAIALQAPAGAPERIAGLPWDGLRARAEGKPLWLILDGQAAGGWNVGEAEAASALRQAAWLARGVLLARAAEVDAAWYPGAPCGLGAERLTLALAERGCDLQDANGRPQPGVAALCWAFDAMRGRRLAATLAAPEQARLLLYSGRRALLVAWCTAPGGHGELRLPWRAEQIEVRDVGGTPLSLPGGAAVVPLGESPVYIEPRGGLLSTFAAGAAQAVVRCDAAIAR